MDYGLNNSSADLSSLSLNVSIDSWLVYLIMALVVIALLLIIKKIILIMALNSKYHEHIVYLLRVPKEKPSEKEQHHENNYLQL